MHSSAFRPFTRSHPARQPSIPSAFATERPSFRIEPVVYWPCSKSYSVRDHVISGDTRNDAYPMFGFDSMFVNGELHCQSAFIQGSVFHEITQGGYAPVGAGAQNKRKRCLERNSDASNTTDNIEDGRTSSTFEHGRIKYGCRDCRALRAPVIAQNRA